MNQTKTTDNTQPEPKMQGTNYVKRVDGLHRYRDDVTREIKLLPAEYMEAHLVHGCTEYCIIGKQPETGPQSQLQTSEELQAIVILDEFVKRHESYPDVAMIAHSCNEDAIRMGTLRTLLRIVTNNRRTDKN